MSEEATQEEEQVPKFPYVFMRTLIPKIFPSAREAIRYFRVEADEWSKLRHALSGEVFKGSSKGKYPLLSEIMTFFSIGDMVVHIREDGLSGQDQDVFSSLEKIKAYLPSESDAFKEALSISNDAIRCATFLEEKLSSVAEVAAQRALLNQPFNFEARLTNKIEQAGRMVASLQTFTTAHDTFKAHAKSSKYAGFAFLFGFAASLALIAWWFWVWGKENIHLYTLKAATLPQQPPNAPVETVVPWAQLIDRFAGTAEVVLVITLAVWVSKVLLKLGFRMLDEAADSSRRAAFLDAYVGLVGQGELTTPEEKKVLLTSIFADGKVVTVEPEAEMPMLKSILESVKSLESLIPKLTKSGS